MKKNGFTLVEILIVVAIVSLLAAISAPPFMQHTRRARALEAISAMALIREELRNYRINHDTYFDITSDNIQNGLPTTVSAGVPTPNTAGVEVNVGVAKYFSNASYTVDATSPASTRFTNPAPVDFIITANGASSVACGSSNCATQNAAVSTYRLEMDNTDRVFISYDGGTTWAAY